MASVFSLLLIIFEVKEEKRKVNVTRCYDLFSRENFLNLVTIINTALFIDTETWLEVSDDNVISKLMLTLILYVGVYHTIILSFIGIVLINHFTYLHSQQGST